MAFQSQGGIRDQLLMSPSIDDWVRPDDIVRFYVQTVEALNIPLEKFNLNWRGTGDPMYEPHAMLTLVLYLFYEGIFTTRKMEKACRNLVPARFIMGNVFPDHSTIARFIKKNGEVLREMNTRVLMYGLELGVLKKLNELGIDGSLFHASASRQKNRTTEQLEKEVQKLQNWFDECVAKTLANDELEANTPDESRLPESMNDPEKLRKQLELAKKRLAERQRLDEEELAKLTPEQLQQLEKQRAEKAAAKAAEEASESVKNESKPVLDSVSSSEAEKPVVENPTESEEKNDQAPPAAGGSEVQTDTNQKPSKPAKKKSKKLKKGEVADPRERKLNTTDPETRLMTKGTIVGIDQRWNVQLAVDTNSRLIVGGLVSNENDSHLLLPTLETIPKELGTPRAVVADSGYFSEANFRGLDEQGIRATIPSQMKLPGDEGSTPRNTMSSPYLIAKAREARTPEGKEGLKRRKTTVEPTFATMKWLLGFRDFLRRGHKKVTQELMILITTINIKRLRALLAPQG